MSLSLSSADGLTESDMRLVAGVPRELLIGGRPRPAARGNRFGIVNPATGQVFTDVADADPADALDALQCAADSQKSWAATPARQRAEILRRAFDLIQERRDDMARVMTLEMGKPLKESLGEIAYGSEFLRWFSEEAVRFGGRTATAPAGQGDILVTKVPVGPVLAVTPWNFPLAMGTRKIGPALAAGCTIIVKPAGETPLTMLMLGQIFVEAGLPEGVLSILTSTNSASISSALMDDPRLRKVTFTGSTPVGKVLVRSAADRLLRTSMELGGNAPFIVFEDADIDLAVEGALAAKMRNGGQACTAANRFLIHGAVVEEFTDKLTARFSALRTGAGVHPGSEVGPLISEKQRQTVSELVADATGRGARVRTGGYAPEGVGYFYAPTVLDRVPADARLVHEEIFGPVAAIRSFDTEQAAVEAANNTQYGLAAYVFTRDLDRARRVVAELETGMVGVNRGIISDAAAPFGGVKQSGFGREGGTEGIEEYLEAKYVAI